MTDIHSCSYYCDRPECIKAQRDELRDRLAQLEQDTVQRLSALVRAQQITIDKLEAQSEQPAQQQEPVAWLTEERYAEMHTSKWTPKIQQVFSKDGILESQTIQYAPQSKTVPYPPAQRTWLGLTDEEAVQTWEGVIKYAPGDVRIKDFARAIEAKLKEKNT